MVDVDLGHVAVTVTRDKRWETPSGRTADGAKPADRNCGEGKALERRTGWACVERNAFSVAWRRPAWWTAVGALGTLVVQWSYGHTLNQQRLDLFAARTHPLDGLVWAVVCASWAVGLLAMRAGPGNPRRWTVACALAAGLGAVFLWSGLNSWPVPAQSFWRPAHDLHLLGTIVLLVVFVTAAVWMRRGAPSTVWGLLLVGLGQFGYLSRASQGLDPATTAFYLDVAFLLIAAAGSALVAGSAVRTPAVVTATP
jgi:hypothetical protein